MSSLRTLRVRLVTPIIALNLLTWGMGTTSVADALEAGAPSQLEPNRVVASSDTTLAMDPVPVSTSGQVTANITGYSPWAPLKLGLASPTSEVICDDYSWPTCSSMPSVNLGTFAAGTQLVFYVEDYCWRSSPPGIYYESTNSLYAIVYTFQGMPNDWWIDWNTLRPWAQPGFCDNWDTQFDNLTVHIHTGEPVTPVPDTQTLGPCGPTGSVNNPTACLADPVNTATGNYVTTVTDASLPGIGLPFEFTRTYNSADSTSGDLGPGWTHSYADSLAVQPNGDVEYRAATGQEALFVLQPDGSFAGLGVRAKLTADNDGYTLTTPHQERYRFDTSGRLLSLSDRNDNQLSLAYESSNLSTITDTAGRVIQLTHDPSGLLTGLLLEDGRSVTYGYTDGALTSVTDMRAGITTYSYDPGERLSMITDQNQHVVVENVYGDDGRVIQQFDGLGHETDYAWDPATQTATVTDARGHEWKDEYVGNRLFRRIDPLGNATLYSYDDQLNSTSVTYASGHAWGMTYDNRGNLLSRTSPAPQNYREVFTYTARNDVATWTDFRGNLTTYDYDADGNLIRITQPEGAITRFAPDPATGLPISRTDPRGKIWSYEYDADGNRKSETSPLGNKTGYAYDPSGRMIERIDPRGYASGHVPADYTWHFAYDEADHLTTTTSPLGYATISTFDPVGNLDTVQDAKGRVTDYEYDELNRLVRVTPPDTTAPTVYAYDEVGNRISRMDPEGHTWSYGYDEANRQTSVTSPLGSVWSTTYTPTGQIQTRVLPEGNATPTAGDWTITYAYDHLDRLTGIDYSDATPDVSFAYDENSNTTSMTDGSGTTSYVYDDLNRLTQVTKGADTFSYTYDPASNLLSRTYPGDVPTVYTYDFDSRLSTASHGTGITNYGYDEAGNVLSTTLPSSNGHVEARTYDRDGRLTGVVNRKGTATLSSFSYTLDEMGNPIRVDTSSGVVTYGYDPLRDWLTEACFQATCSQPTDPFIRYTYDRVGNRITESRPAGTTTYTYDIDDRLTQTSGPSGTVAYTFDRNGNETAAGSRTFTYDLANRVGTTTSGSTTLTYTYDGLGRRLRASTGTQASKIINYLWDVNSSLPMLALERDGSNRLLRRYTYGHRLIAMLSGSSDYFFHFDRLGSTANVTSSSGVKQWSYTYEPFGGARTETKDSTKAPANVMRFAGEYLDPTSLLYHLRAREYDSLTGRFLEIDPEDHPLTEACVSTYVYAANQPTRLVDPSGRSPWVGPGAWWKCGRNLSALLDYVDRLDVWVEAHNDRYYAGQLPQGILISPDYERDELIIESGYFYDAAESCGGAAGVMFKLQWQFNRPPAVSALTSSIVPLGVSLK